MTFETHADPSILSAAVSRRNVLAGGLAAGLGLALAACSSTQAGTGTASSAGGSASAGQRLFMTPKWTGFPYYEQARQGAQKATDELKGKFTYAGADHPDVSQQSTTLQNFVTQQAQGIMLAAIDANAVAPALKAARAKGIKVVTFDADAAVEARDLFCNQLTYPLAATTMLDAALANDPSGGKIAFVAATPTAPNHKAQIALMREQIKTNPRYKNFVPLAQTYFANDDDSQSYQIAVNLMQANPDLKYIVSPSAVSTPAAARAVVARKASGHVYATGFALPSAMKQFIQDGSNKAFALWDPAQLGYIAAYATHLLITGQLKPVKGTTFTAGSEGTYTVGDNGEVPINKPIIFTPNNIGQYNF
ncbi:MAG: putative exported protein [Actinomycetia bacterium]|nr:putative exported protein [Actinomycetes bacterium]